VRETNSSGKASQATATPPIAIRGLTKTYKRGREEVAAVRDLDLEVQANEVFGFLGPNGAGKTTTVKCLLGLARPSTGRASVLGHPAGSMEARKRLGYLPENPYFYDYLTGLELLDWVGRVAGVNGADRLRRAGELLERVGMSHAARIQLRKYSRGMMQRIGLAQALMNDPELLVFDEPMNGLDPIGRAMAKELIRELKTQGKTVFFNTHILSDVEELCDRVGIIVNAELKAAGPVAEVRRPGMNLEQTFVEVVNEAGPLRPEVAR